MNSGQILAEKYRLIEQLSRGGMGAVWRAEHIELGTPAAVKLIDPLLADTEEAVHRFRREAQAAASLRSANIVQILDYGVANGSPYIAMELLRGKSLARHLSQVGRLTPIETTIILSQVGKAVAWAHSMGVVHRDLKPDNIFLAEDAGETVVKLLDFGIAKTLDVRLVEPPTTITGAMMGTPFYMSPEQTSGQKVVDSRSDIWAFAVIAFECLTGQRPFQSETLGSLVLAICSEPIPIPSAIASVPAGFDEWFARAAHRDLQQRYHSIREAAKELRRICAAGIDDEALGLSSENGDSSNFANPPSDDLSTSTIPMAEVPGSLYTMSAATPAARRPRLGGVRGASLLLLGVAILGVVLGLVREPAKPIPSTSTHIVQSSAPAAPTLAPMQMPVQSEPMDAKLTGPTVELVDAGESTPSNAAKSGSNPISSPRPRLTSETKTPPNARASGEPVNQHEPPIHAEPAAPDLDKLVGF